MPSSSVNLTSKAIKTTSKTIQTSFHSRDAGVDLCAVDPLVDLLLLVVGDADPPVLVPQRALAGNARHVFLERIEVEGS